MKKRLFVTMLCFILVFLNLVPAVNAADTGILVKETVSTTYLPSGAYYVTTVREYIPSNMLTDAGQQKSGSKQLKAMITAVMFYFP